MLGVITSSNPRARYLKKKRRILGSETARVQACVNQTLVSSSGQSSLLLMVSATMTAICFFINNSNDERGCDDDHDDGMI